MAEGPAYQESDGTDKEIMVNTSREQLIEDVKRRLDEWQTAPPDERQYAAYARHTSLVSDIQRLLDAVCTTEPTPEWHKQLSHVLLENHMPTEEEIQHYKVAWGESQIAHLTDWRYWEEIYNVALEMIRLQSIDIDELRMQLRNAYPPKGVNDETN